eukprot:CAMPEP_0114975502 /NCGR_PEP_ID=MMETSP0216-20121206/2138_1 /TAXON_ID=223996 /ORGANISM="Protocruzia adherens, Strain Boccale" /LENGTH=357 /DNA_ID=CAMNT_0002336297 /DNA_START=176 /DNA_END=1246 /DNA_ORIENTATION=+
MVEAIATYFEFESPECHKIFDLTTDVRVFLPRKRDIGHYLSNFPLVAEARLRKKRHGIVDLKVNLDELVDQIRTFLEPEFDCTINNGFLHIYDQRIGIQRAASTVREPREDVSAEPRVSLLPSIRLQTDSSVSNEFIAVETSLMSPAFTEESFALYQKYQTIIHNDRPYDIHKQLYKDQFCSSPITASSDSSRESSSSSSVSYGTYHVHYRIRRRLVAVELVDILPSGIVSQYLFYDPEYKHFGMGTISALKQIQLIQKTTYTPFRYYYLGYYISGNNKMSYKGRFNGAELMCPESGSWCRLSGCVQDIKELGYVRLSDSANHDVEQMDHEEVVEAIERSVYVTGKGKEGYFDRDEW